MIPQFIKEIKGLRVFDRCLLSQIHFLSAQRGYCFAGNAYFADFFEVSEGTVKRSLKKMEQMRLLNRVTSWNKRYIYVTCLPAKDEQEKKAEQPQRNQNKEHVKYGKEGFRFFQKLLQSRRYHRAPKDQGWTEDGLAAADACFEQWKKKIMNSS